MTEPSGKQTARMSLLLDNTDLKCTHMISGCSECSARFVLSLLLPCVEALKLHSDAVAALARSEFTAPDSVTQALLEAQVRTNNVLTEMRGAGVIE